MQVFQTQLLKIYCLFLLFLSPLHSSLFLLLSQQNCRDPASFSSSKNRQKRDKRTRKNGRSQSQRDCVGTREGMGEARRQKKIEGGRGWTGKSKSVLEERRTYSRLDHFQISRGYPCLATLRYEAIGILKLRIGEKIFRLEKHAHRVSFNYRRGGYNLKKHEHRGKLGHN